MKFVSRTFCPSTETVIPATFVFTKTPPVAVMVQERNIGACVSRNLAIREAKGELLLFVDSDVSCPDSEVLTLLVDRFLAEPHCAGAAPVIYSDWERQCVWFTAGYLRENGIYDGYRSMTDTDDPHFVSTCFWLSSKKAILESGGFDPFYFYLFEDTDLCLRLRRMGHHFLVVQEAGVWHRLHESGRIYRCDAEQRDWGQYRRSYYLIKNYGWRTYLRTWWGMLGRWSYMKQLYDNSLSLKEFFRFYLWHPFCLAARTGTIRRNRKANFLIEKAS